MTNAVNIAQLGSAGVSTMMKNRIINGAMIINQRATTITDSGYSTDRWSYNPSTASKASVAQSSVAPAGFTNSLLVTSSAATTVGSTDIYMVEQKIEGYNVADLGWGTATAQTVTLSFWVRSSLTGSFGAAVGNAGPDRSYPFSYTINSANTWEYKTITIPGDTTGTWNSTNGAGIRVMFSVGSGSSRSATANAWTGTSNVVQPTGSVSLIATSGATLYLTGVQLEVGSSATGFEYRPYGQELALCQRYCEIQGNVSSFYVSPGTLGMLHVIMPMFHIRLQKRVSATVTTYGTGGYPNNAGKMDIDGVGDASVTAQAFDTCGFRIQGMPSPYSGQGGYKAEAEL